MTTTQHDFSHYLEAAHALAPAIAASADQIDNERQIPSDIVGEIADKGLFRLLVHRSLDGAELDFLDFLRILQVFARADASTAWCIAQNNIWATHSARMPEQTAREIWGDPRAVVSNGPPISSAKAVPVDGGYRITGRWNFSTGIRHATWVAAITPIDHPEESGETPGSQRDMRVLLVPKKEVTVVDAWQVKGLRGTGTFSFDADDLFVPSVHTYKPSDPSRVCGALYAIPTGLLFAAAFATVALGVARAALDSTIELASDKYPAFGQQLLRDMPATHRLIGEAEALWRSSNAFLRESILAAWESAQTKPSITIEERVQLRLATTHAIRTAAQVVDIGYNLCGSSAIFASNPVQRRFQDIHVITHQAQGRMANIDTAGKFYLGLEPDGLI